jgi:membrane protease subunit HflC
MSDTRNIAILGGSLVALMIAAGSTFIVAEAEQALVLQFGEIKRVERTPGLKFKWPMIQEVQRFDKRLLDFRAEPRELITKDSERILVDAFARYRIVNPVQYYVAVRNEQTMQSRLGAILESSVRQIIASVPLKAVLAEDRAGLMKTIRDNVNAQVRGVVKTQKNEDGTEIEPAAGAAAAPKGGFGIEVVDVRIMRSDLPAENSEAIYNRMRTEREREAREFRARGAEEAVVIRSEADRQRVVLIAEAQKKAEILRGEGDAEAARVYNNAIGQDPRFFELWRSLQAYRESLRSENTTVVLSPGNGFLKQFEQRGN